MFSDSQLFIPVVVCRVSVVAATPDTCELWSVIRIGVRVCVYWAKTGTAPRSARRVRINLRSLLTVKSPSNLTVCERAFVGFNDQSTVGCTPHAAELSFE